MIRIVAPMLGQPQWRQTYPAILVEELIFLRTP